MTREEAQLFKSRWRLANERIAQEIRDTPLLTRLHQLARMFAAGAALGWQEKMRSGEEEIFERWQKLREKLHGVE
ncbi:MAG: hypothetical protein J2P31_07895 [Blastocatellia bacterium]|nr:hypothetical protein [Blastocatellia bacterium]